MLIDWPLFAMLLLPASPCPSVVNEKAFCGSIERGIGKYNKLHHSDLIKCLVGFQTIIVRRTYLPASLSFWPRWQPLIAVCIGTRPKQFAIGYTRSSTNFQQLA
jgi:hypothetical protein